MADLGALLVQNGAIDKGQLDSARSHQRSFGGRIEEILVNQRMVSEPRLADAISKVTGTRRVKLDVIQPEGAARAKLPVAAAEEEPAFPVALRDEGRTLWVAVTDPTDITMLDRLATRAGCRVRPVVAGGKEIRRAIALHYRGQEEEHDPETKEPAESTSSGGFKITDVSGKTVLTSKDVLRKQHEAGVQQASSDRAFAGHDDDDPAADLFDIQALSPDETARLKKVLAHQEKSSIVLDALLELLAEKGLMTSEELRERSEP